MLLTSNKHKPICQTRDCRRQYLYLQLSISHPYPIYRIDLGCINLVNSHALKKATWKNNSNFGLNLIRNALLNQFKNPILLLA